MARQNVVSNLAGSGLSLHSFSLFSFSPLRFTVPTNFHCWSGTTTGQSKQPSTTIANKQPNGPIFDFPFQIAFLSHKFYVYRTFLHTSTPETHSIQTLLLLLFLNVLTDTKKEKKKPEKTPKSHFQLSYAIISVLTPISISNPIIKFAHSRSVVVLSKNDINKRKEIVRLVTDEEVKLSEKRRCGRHIQPPLTLWREREYGNKKTQEGASWL